MKEFKWSQDFANACMDHAQDVGSFGLVSSVGSDGTLIDDRIKSIGCSFGP